MSMYKVILTLDLRTSTKKESSAVVKFFIQHVTSLYVKVLRIKYKRYFVCHRNINKYIIYLQ